MAKVHDKSMEQVEQVFTNAEDYKQRIAQFLEKEGDGIRKEADQESAYIIARAREAYSQRLSQFLEEEGEKIRKQAKRAAGDIITKALEEKEHIFTEARNMAESQLEEVIKKVKMQAEQTVSRYANTAQQRAEKMADEYRDECKKRAEQEAATIIDNANEQAIQIIAQAKERAKKQANEEKHEEVERILESARLKAAEVIRKAKQAADKEAEETASKIISVAQQRAAQITSEAMDKLKNGEEEELTKLMFDEKRRSELETTDMFAGVEQEAGQLIRKVINDTDGRGEVVDEDNKIEYMEEIESVVETGEKVKELGKSETIPDNDQVEEIIPISHDLKVEKLTEVEGEKADVTSESIWQLEDESPLSNSETALAEQDKPAEVAESSETFIEARNLEIEETESNMVGQDDESIYTGKVEIELSLSLDKEILTKLYSYLLHTPDIKNIKTCGSSGKGVIATAILDKPIPLVKMLSSKLPEAQVTNEPLGKKGKKHIVRRIRIDRRGS